MIAPWCRGLMLSLPLNRSVAVIMEPDDFTKVLFNEVDNSRHFNGLKFDPLMQGYDLWPILNPIM